MDTVTYSFLSFLQAPRHLQVPHHAFWSSKFPLAQRHVSENFAAGNKVILPGFSKISCFLIRELVRLGLTAFSLVRTSTFVYRCHNSRSLVLTVSPFTTLSVQTSVSPNTRACVTLKDLVRPFTHLEFSLFSHSVVARTFLLSGLGRPLGRETAFSVSCYCL